MKEEKQDLLTSVIVNYFVGCLAMIYLTLTVLSFGAFHFLVNSLTFRPESTIENK